ncbi:phosphoglycerate dehydrogenase-like enzyme [Actinomadura luteofluorescens]|uniref:Phosphoglycerate dehydrogenase-like enzyme n=1 Tax=Actinomadura luteofluorescens TaxID=46163 RepID=A0A7Y9ENZ9_9ACTN|nr:D-2-hydroxyacid dehydrogenase [Actinomadura luteofluorescens]NYD51239.1 phosphoglycerate dehydrogenase-like enzyme [Actinomadura luteofluorescens]
MDPALPASGGPPDVVVLLGDVDPRGMEEAEGLARIRYVRETELAKALPGADVLFMWDFLSDALAGAWPESGGPRWVHIASAGVDRLMFPGLTHSDTIVTNSRGVFDEPIAEYVLGLVLAFAKDLHTTLRLQGERRWRHRETERVTGSRALVVGTGPIGRAIGRRLSAAGLAVSGAGRTARDADPDLGVVHPMERLGEALAEADYVVLAAPLTPQTRKMIDAAALERMRPSARLVNVGRGGLVAEDDLVEALRAGRIAGAALDVFEDEPLPASSPLWDLPNVIVSPHMSGDVVGWRDELVRLFADNLGRYVSGRPLRNVVDKRLGYVGSERAATHQRG